MRTVRIVHVMLDYKRRGRGRRRERGSRGERKILERSRRRQRKGGDDEKYRGWKKTRKGRKGGKTKRAVSGLKWCFKNRLRGGQEVEHNRRDSGSPPSEQRWVL